MCANICRSGAIRMDKMTHGFLHPYIDASKCVDCGICRNNCPVNKQKPVESNVLTVYAAWNKDKKVRKESTSGGLFSLLAKSILDAGGVVVGVRWNSEFQVEHFIATDSEQFKDIRGSKYVQSHTGSIYTEVERCLKSGKSVLFSGTPCQNHAIRLFLKSDYPNLYQVDVICHGVPSDDMLQKYLREQIGEKDIKVTNIRLRHKNPYWSFCNVTIDYSDGSQYTMPSVDDPYYTLFNIGYSLRESCRNCQYTSTHRYGDITLADFWRYSADCFKMRDYQNGVSCVLINSEKGSELFQCIADKLIYSESTLETAKAGNKPLSSSFSLPQDVLNGFWKDYEDGMSVRKLCDKYVPNRFKKPDSLWLHQIKNRYRWVKHI